MEDLTGQWANLSLNNRESTTVNLSDNEVGNSRVLVAKYFIKRRINFEATTRTLKSMWRDGGNFDVRDLGNNTAMLIFDDEDDPKWILMQGLWSFDKCLIGLFRLDEAAMVEDAKFDTASFWVQIHGLQIRQMTKANVVAIASMLGRVESVEETVKGDCRRRCTRVQVNIDISQPLCRGCLVNVRDSQTQWISFKYECMPNFCYWCGVMNHDEKDCRMWVNNQGTLKEDQ